MRSLFDAIGASAHTTIGLAILLDAFLKGSVLLIMALLLSLLLRRAAAATRHLVWNLALISLLALPILSFMLPAWNVPIVPQVMPAAPHFERSTTPAPPQYRLPKSRTQPMLVSDKKTWTVSTNYSSEFAPAQNKSNWLTLLSSLTLPAWFFLIWLSGVVIVSGRWMCGWLCVSLLSRRSEEIRDDEWHGLSEGLSAELGLRQPVTLLRAKNAAAPMTWGFLHPVILLPHDADTWPAERRRVVLLHELAHVKRGDFFAQIVAQIACALYWFNPLAWIAGRKLRAEREQACDDAVLNAGAKASDYANHILEILRSLRLAQCSPSAAVAMAQCSKIEGRLRAILNPNLRRRALTPTGEMLVGAGIACIVLPLAAISPWARMEKKPEPANKLVSPNIRFQQTDPKINLNISASTDPMVIAPWNASLAEPAESSTASGDCNEEKSKQNFVEKWQLDQFVENGVNGVGQSVLDAVRALGSENVKSEHLVGQASEEIGKYLAGKLRELGYEAQTADEYARRVSYGFDDEYVQDLKKAGYPNLSIEELLQMRIHGVDAEYIKAMKDAGFGDLSVEDLIQLHIHGVDGEYAKEMKAAGFADLSIEQLLQMRIHGVDAEYAKEMKTNYSDLSLDDLLQLRIQGVDAEYAKAMKAAYGDLSINELLQLRIQGVDADYAKGMKGAGFDDLSIDQLLQLRIQGVDADYAKAMKATYGDLSIDELLQLRIQGVDADYAKEMKGAGFDDLSIDQLLQLRIQGVDADYAKAMKATYGDLSISELLQLRIQGVDADYAKEMKVAGFGDLSIDELLQLRIQGVDAHFVKELQEAGLKNLSPEKLIRMKIQGFDASF
jgi:beta-lactamase regulating signal transducer with metallopeptidase domain